MTTTTAALALALGLLGDPAAKPAPDFPLDAAGTSRDFDKPPPGSAADQALWKTAYDVDNDLVIAQFTSTRLQATAKTNAYLERLRDPAARGALSGDEARALANRLEGAWTANMSVTASIWPVSKVRVCRYELQIFEGVMLAGQSPRTEAQLDDARRALQACVAKAGTVQAALDKANADLEAAIAAADRAIGPAYAQNPSATAAPAPARN